MHGGVQGVGFRYTARLQADRIGVTGWVRNRADGTSLGGDPFRSSWNQTIAPGQTRRGTLVFPGHLDPAGTTATLSFATVFEQGFDGPSSIVVGGLELAPVE